MYSISSDTLPAVRGMHAKCVPRGGKSTSNGGESTSNGGESTSTADLQVFRQADWLKINKQSTDM